MSEWAVTLQSGEETEVLARASRITSTGDLLFLIDILPALKNRDSYGAMHESPHAQSLRRVPASLRLREVALRPPPG